MGEQRLEIVFETSGSKQVISAIKGINIATTGLVKGQKDAAKKSTSAFAKMRSGIGLTVTAIGTAITAIDRIISRVVQFGKFVTRTSSKLVEFGGRSLQVERAFEGLTGAAGESADVFVKKVSAALRGTVSDFEIMRQVNTAFRLGVIKTSDDAARLADAALILGRVVGRDATEAFADLTTGIGRLSPLILDNLGIVTSGGKIYEDFAKKLGKTAEQLTDAERKQTLLNLAIESASQLSKQITSDTDTASEAFKRVGVTVDNFVKQLAQFVAKSPAVTEFAEFLKKALDGIAKSFDLTGGAAEKFLSDFLAGLKETISAVVDNKDEIIAFLVNTANGLKDLIGALLKVSEIFVRIVNFVGQLANLFDRIASLNIADIINPIGAVGRIAGSVLGFGGGQIGGSRFQQAFLPVPPVAGQQGIVGVPGAGGGIVVNAEINIDLAAEQVAQNVGDAINESSVELRALFADVKFDIQKDRQILRNVIQADTLR